MENHDHHQHLHAKHNKIREELKAHIGMHGSWIDRTAEFLSLQFGSLWFLGLNAAFFFGWILINTGYTSIAPFDPYPFILLTMLVSLEAIILTIIILTSQNRQGRVADLRERIDVEIDVRAEEEISKVLSLLEKVAKKLDIPINDPELHRMEKHTDLQKIQAEIEQSPER